MAKKKPTKPGDLSQPVSLTMKDAARVANVVNWYESTARPRNPSKLSRAPGGSGGVIRLGQFSGWWPNEPGESGVENIKLVTLFTQPVSATGGNDWVPVQTGNEVTRVAAVNFFSFIPTRSGGDTLRWCAVCPISGLPGTYATGYGTDTGTYENLWLLIAAEC